MLDASARKAEMLNCRKEPVAEVKCTLPATSLRLAAQIGFDVLSESSIDPVVSGSGPARLSRVNSPPKSAL